MTPDDAGEAGGTSEESGSQGYQGDSAGYRTSTEHPSAEPSSSDEHPRSDFARILAEAEAAIERREALRTPALWLPDAEDLDREPQQEDETAFSLDQHIGRDSKQLGLRLRPEHFERLCQAADVYGVRPTTLARMMVIRGVNAIRDAELARRGELLRGE